MAVNNSEQSLPPCLAQQGQQSRVDDYTIIKTLGRGSTSKAKLARNRQGKYVCLKILQPSKQDAYHVEVPVLKALSGFPYSLQYEGGSVESMYNSRNPRKCRLVSYISTDYAFRGDLFNYLANFGKFPTEIGRFYYKCILELLQQLESKNLAHRDIKPENIFFDYDFVIKVGDYGFCIENKVIDSFKGTRPYMAPEIFDTRPHYPLKADIFSSAIIAFIMYIGWPPFTQAARSNQLYMTIIQNNWRIFWRTHERKSSDPISQEFKDLMEKLLAFDPEQRLSISEILNCPWMSLPIASQDDARCWMLAQLQRVPRLIPDYSPNDTSGYQNSQISEKQDRELIPTQENQKPKIGFNTSLQPDFLFKMMKENIQECEIARWPDLLGASVKILDQDNQVEFDVDISATSDGNYFVGFKLRAGPEFRLLEVYRSMVGIIK